MTDPLIYGAIHLEQAEAFLARDSWTAQDLAALLFEAATAPPPTRTGRVRERDLGAWPVVGGAGLNASFMKSEDGE